MKKAFAGLLSLLLTFTLHAAASAGSKQVTGQVIEINTRDRTITVKGRKGYVLISVTDKTKVTAEVIKSPDDLNVGDKVTVKYKGKKEKNAAKSIAIRAVQ
jgi:uncharacterized OB-fold protein